MNAHLPCFLHTSDEGLVRTIRGYLRGLTEVRQAGADISLISGLQQFDPAVLIADLRAADGMAVLSEVERNGLNTVILGLAPERSEPARTAESMKLFALDTIEIPAGRLRGLVRAALDQAALLEENHRLGRRETGHPPEAPPGGAASGPGLGFQLTDLLRALRRFDKPDSMLAHIVEWIAQCARLSRVGIFALARSRKVYRFRAGLHQLPDTVRLEIGCHAPLARWLHIHAHLVSAASVAGERDRATQQILRQALLEHGAEAIVPFHGREGLIGWMFAGRHITGRPFSAGDLEELTFLADLAAIATENSLLHEEVALQKTLAETVLHSIPVGIVATGPDGFVESFNPAAGDNLDVPFPATARQRIENLGSRPADLLRRCLSEGDGTLDEEWVYGVKRRTLSVCARRLKHAGNCLGAVAIIRDLTAERRAMEQQKQQERMLDWSEMVSAVSHEIRNPLTAINTFAQLLPDRMEDSDFRGQFAELVGREVQRLNGLLDQLQGFAHPRDMVRQRTAPAPLLAGAIERARLLVASAVPRVVLEAAGAFPDIHADPVALTDGIAHLIANAMEASPAGALVKVILEREPLDKAMGRRLAVRIVDSGPGIPETIRSSVFSPFCTTKARGIGLGLPIARRIVLEHGGDLNIQTGPRGTTVTVWLPGDGELVAPDGEPSLYETCIGRG